jgi:hypothetical protein
MSVFCDLVTFLKYFVDKEQNLCLYKLNVYTFIKSRTKGQNGCTNTISYIRDVFTHDKLQNQNPLYR